jgi:hypothetical protein
MYGFRRAGVAVAGGDTACYALGEGCGPSPAASPQPVCVW